jgi:tetratricopeptide (TPR) repeat protein
MRMFLLALVAASALGACHRSPPETPEAFAQAAAEMHRSHEYSKAIELYRRSLALRPDPGVRGNLARALAADGNFAEAAEQYKLLLEADPANGALWHDYGIVLEKGIKDLQAAEDALFNATRYPPRPPEASYDLGRVLLQRGRYEDAGACFEAAIAFGSPKAPWFEDAQLQQVQAYLLAKKDPPPPK